MTNFDPLYSFCRAAGFSPISATSIAHHFHRILDTGVVKDPDPFVAAAQAWEYFLEWDGEGHAELINRFQRLISRKGEVAVRDAFIKSVAECLSKR